MEFCQFSKDQRTFQTPTTYYIYVYIYYQSCPFWLKNRLCIIAVKPLQGSKFGSFFNLHPLKQTKQCTFTKEVVLAKKNCRVHFLTPFKYSLFRISWGENGECKRRVRKSRQTKEKAGHPKSQADQKNFFDRDLK